MAIKLKIEVDSTEINEAIEKANQLVKALKEAQQIIGSLSSKTETKNRSWWQ